MIRRVRRQFICITMAMLTTVLLIPLIALNVITEAMSYNQTRNLLEQIAISETTVRQMPDGAPPDGKQPQETTDAVPAAGSDTSTETTVTTTASTTTTAETTTVQTERAPAETKAAGNGAPAPAAVQTQPPTPRQTAAPKATTAAPRATTARQTKTPVTTTKAVVSRETKPAATQPPQPDPPRQTEPDLPPDPPPWWGWDDPPHDYEDNRENYAARQPVLYAMPLASLAQSVHMNDSGRNAPPFPDKRGDVVTIDHFLCFANAEGTLMRLDGTENYTDANGTDHYDQVAAAQATAGQWVEIKGNYTVPSGATDMILYVEMPGANTDQTYYIDDVVIKGEKTEIQLDDKFESDFDNNSTQKWNGRGSAEIELSTKYAHSGTTSLYVSGRTQLWNGATRSASDIMEAGGYYKVGTYVLYDGDQYTDTQKFSINLQYDLNGKENYYTIATETANKGEWKYVGSEFTVPEGATNFYIYVQTGY